MGRKRMRVERGRSHLNEVVTRRHTPRHRIGLHGSYFDSSRKTFNISIPLRTESRRQMERRNTSFLASMEARKLYLSPPFSSSSYRFRSLTQRETLGNIIELEFRRVPAFPGRSSSSSSCLHAAMASLAPPPAARALHPARPQPRSQVAPHAKCSRALQATPSEPQCRHSLRASPQLRPPLGIPPTFRSQLAASEASGG